MSLVSARVVFDACNSKIGVVSKSSKTTQRTNLCEEVFLLTSCTEMTSHQVIDMHFQTQLVPVQLFFLADKCEVRPSDVENIS